MTGGVCDANLGCVPEAVPDGTVCGDAPVCNTNDLTAFHCQSGQCVPYTESCGHYVCMPDQMSCPETCTKTADCVSGYYCKSTLNQCISTTDNNPPVIVANISGGGKEDVYIVEVPPKGEVTLDASESYDPDFDAISYQWECITYGWGNGQVVFTSTEPKVTTTAFDKIGNYRCSIQLTDEAGNTSKWMHQLSIYVVDPNNAAPVIVWSSTPGSQQHKN